MNTSFMTQVRLVTATGDLVVEGQVPPFSEAPEVLVWGTRVFVDTRNNSDEMRVYREAFTVYLAITTPPPGVAPSNEPLESNVFPAE